MCLQQSNTISQIFSKLFIRKRILLTFLLVFTSCWHNPQAAEEPNLDLDGFISFFELYEAYCPYFAHKEIDWKADIGEYNQEVFDCTSEDELVAIVVEMLANIQDTAIYLQRLENDEVVDTIYPYSKDYEVNYNMNVLVENYLEPNGWLGWEEGYSEGLGWCNPEQFPYIFLDTIAKTADSFSQLDAFIAECNDLELPAVIVDLRMNPHGYYGEYHAVGRQFIGRFAEKVYPGAIYRSRSGSEYDQYADLRPSVKVMGPEQYTGQVIVLVGENCSNMTENMLANFRNFPNVVILGDTTRGNVSYMQTSQLTTNWRFSIVTETILTYQHHWIEGNGIYPDIAVEATEADFAAGVDPVLDYAIEMLALCKP